MKLISRTLPIISALILLCFSACFAQNSDIQKQNILTISRWISSGYLDEPEMKSALSVLKRQVWLLKQEYAAKKAGLPAGIFADG